MKCVIGYLGPHGSFSESVAHRLIGQPPFAGCEFVLSPSLSELMSMIESGVIHVAVFPIRNSKGGLLKSPDGRIFMERLAHEGRHLKWIGERFLPLEFCLLGTQTAWIEAISRVHTNEYTKILCAEYLALHPSWHVRPHASSSKAAERVSTLNQHNHAALASKDAARQYNLQIIDGQVTQPGQEPVMHFIYIANKDFQAPHPPTAPKISTHLFRAPSAIKLLDELNQQDKLEYQTLYALSDSTFVVDFNGEIPPQSLPKNLAKLWLHHFGTYPCDSNISRCFPGDF